VVVVQVEVADHLVINVIILLIRNQIVKLALAVLMDVRDVMVQVIVIQVTVVVVFNVKVVMVAVRVVV
jgi:hypothetical protein